jgi:hypothetical protein
MAEKKRCAICKKGFTPKRSDARFCSAACKQRAYRLRQRVWSGDEHGNVRVDGKWEGQLALPLLEGYEAAGRAAEVLMEPWERTGTEAQTVSELFPGRDLVEAAGRGIGPAATALRHYARELRHFTEALELPPRSRDGVHLRAARRELQKRAREAEREELAMPGKPLDAMVRLTWRDRA